ncbi:MAG TPA: hypothetical protein P5272_04360 [Caldisericia bacterium]|nr:hypothetical protein [Caldisericia bacterium]HPC56923.1 hypothetical protein [Caldisericia bacterium]HPP43537.1 hypothetical protein [Caldisericia bacterium]HRT37344.1 hypothetical protein [Caldisericia bacterium]HRU74198.1 hypothetical protein [Caldisericia bacterium]
MVKKIIIILFLILLILFPPIFPKNLIKGENKNIKDYFGFVITYFNKDIERTSIWAYEVKGYNLNGIILKNINSEKSYIFSKEGELIKEGEVSGLPVIYFKEESVKNNYESIKNYFLSYINIYETIKELNLTPFLDSENDSVYLENEKLKVILGKENFSKRVDNLKTLLSKEDLTGLLDASYDNIIIYRGK